LWRWARGLVLEDTPYSYKSYAASQLKRLSNKANNLLGAKKVDDRDKCLGKGHLSASPRRSYQTHPEKDQ